MDSLSRTPEKADKMRMEMKRFLYQGIEPGHHASRPSESVFAKMTGALLTESWDSVQRLVEALRPSMLKVT